MLAHAFRSTSLKYQAKRLADYSAALIIAVITLERYIALYICIQRGLQCVTVRVDERSGVKGSPEPELLNTANTTKTTIAQETL